MNAYIEQAKEFLKRHTFWVELATYVLLAAGTAFWVGRDAYIQAAELRQEGQRLDAMRRSADNWLSSLQPASSAEAQEWQQIAASLNQLGAGSDSRLTLVEVITRRAERVGLTGVRATLASTDTVPAIARAGAPPVTFKVADFAIIVDFKGSLAATRAFLANLPPAVGVQRLNMGRTGSTLGTRVVLTVYEAVADAPI